MERSRHRVPRLSAALVILNLVSLFVLTPSSHSAPQQATRTIKVVVGVPPGGAADSLARILAEQISRTQALSMVVENRPGAVNIVAMEAVARAAPDGNTLLLITPAFVLSSQLRRLSYDPFANFEPICFLARTPMVIVVNGASPYSTLADLMKADVRRRVQRFSSPTI